jgi:hypothetical protein
MPTFDKRMGTWLQDALKQPYAKRKPMTKAKRARMVKVLRAIRLLGN